MVSLTHWHLTLKLAAMFINLAVLCMWTVMDIDVIPADTFPKTVLFYHANCGYNLILFLLCLLFVMDEVPSKLVQQLYLVPGVLMFLSAGVLGALGCHDKSLTATAASATLVVVGLLMTIDSVTLQFENCTY